MTALSKPFRLARPGAVDLEFDGVLLAEETSKTATGALAQIAGAGPPPPSSPLADPEKP